jgi:hypothetical protein
MASSVQKWLFKRLPQNLILKKPFAGTLILSAFWLIFIVIYKPLGTHGSRSLSLVTTMVAYGVVIGISIFAAGRILKSIPYFSKEIEWTILKEISAIILILLIMGIAIYFAGFIIEPPSHRWNISTFLLSCKIASLVGIIPLAFCTLINYHYFFINEIEQHYAQVNYQQIKIENEELIHICSQLKKEDLSFYPSQFVYCEADGNYVVFHLFINGQYIKKMIRNSINKIEQQLTLIPFILRIHRAFIVNLKLVASKRGNTLGYQLKFNNIDAEVPVARNNTKNFDQKIKQFQ